MRFPRDRAAFLRYCRLLSYLTAMLLTLVPHRASSAQSSTEWRVDGIAGGPSAVHAGLGVTMQLGTYVSSGLVGALGASRDGLSGRIDLINRFRLDPFREHRWGPYGGGGVSARFDKGRTARPLLLIFAGVEKPATKSVVVSVEAGLGGGGRLGVILRRRPAERR